MSAADEVRTVARFLALRALNGLPQSNPSYPGWEDVIAKMVEQARKTGASEDEVRAALGFNPATASGMAISPNRFAVVNYNGKKIHDNLTREEAEKLLKDYTTKGKRGWSISARHY